MAIASQRFARVVAASAALGLGAAMLPGAAQAQSDDRLRRLETEVRALQRAVFPGGDQRFFEPEISTSQQAQPTRQVGTPSDGALTDMLSRLTAIESQLARLTATSEVNANALEQLESRMDEFEIAAAAAAPPRGVIPLPGGGEADAEEGELPPAAAGGAAQPREAQGRPSPERVAAVAAIEKPSTDDPGDDEYSYGFRLWDAGFYPEAQQQLTRYLQAYPNHSRVTYGRNLLGRAYLDAGDPRTAANFFFENYQTDRQGARAPDSLLFLAESMIELADTNRACIALAEFGDTYPALATGRLREQYNAARNRVDCD